MDKSKFILTVAPALFFSLFMANFSYGVLQKKAPIKVAILDTGVGNYGYRQMCPGEHKSFSGRPSIKDNHPSQHGSNIAAIIEREAGPGNWCFVVIKYTENQDGHIQNFLNGLEYATKIKPAVINISVTGRHYDKKEAQLITTLLAQGTQIVAAAGNDGDYVPKSACNVYPACVDPRIYVIGNSGARTTNRGPFVDYFINGQDVQGAGVSLSGTSQSAARFTGQVVKEALKAY